MMRRTSLQPTGFRISLCVLDRLRHGGEGRLWYLCRDALYVIINTVVMADTNLLLLGDNKKSIRAYFSLDFLQLCFSSTSQTASDVVTKNR